MIYLKPRMALGRKEKKGIMIKRTMMIKKTMIVQKIPIAMQKGVNFLKEKHFSRSIIYTSFFLAIE
jgi:hypothetical protein